MMASTSCRTWSVAAACLLLLVLGATSSAQAGAFTFAAPAAWPTGAGPAATAVADLNGDLLPDLVTVNSFDDTVSVLLGNVSAPGTFQAPVFYATPQSPVDVGIADMNLDGTLDLVVVTCSCVAPLVILFGDPSVPGTFPTSVTYPLAIEPWSLAIADFNSDGLPDLAISSDLDNTVTVLLGNVSAPGTFLAAVSYPVSLNPGAVRAGDFNNDGVLDLAVTALAAETDPDGVTVLLGNAGAPGTFLGGTRYPTGVEPVSLVAADFSGDGVLDLAAGTISSSSSPDATVSVLLGDPGVPGTFDPFVE